MLRIATSFSGGLAAPEFALKYEEIEHEVVFACEWDKYARKQYLEFHGEPQTFYNDISDLNATKYLGEIDLFVWGSPCQDLSLAGKRKGFDGEKSSLFREGARVMSEMMPKVFIFENVKGLLSSNGGADYKEVVKTFQDLGYLIAMKVLNAKEHGTAQNRERVFVVGFLDESEYHTFNFEDKVPLTKVLRDYYDELIDSKYFLDKPFELFKESNGSDIIGKLNYNDNDRQLRIYGEDKIAPTVLARADNTRVLCVGKLNIKGSEQVRRIYDSNGLCPTLDTAQGGNRQIKVKVPSATKCGFEIATQNDSINFTHPDSKTRRGRVGKGVAQTLDCACNQGVIDDYRIRKLTPTECFRLQGIKDEDINLINSDTQSYKIAGNAIEVNTMRSLIRALYKNKESKNNLFDFMGVA